jgi:hypothetical protein
MDITLYEQLAGLNRHFREALSVLQNLERAKELRMLRAQLYPFRLQIEELRACVSELFLDTLAESEQKNAAHCWKRRRKLERGGEDSAGEKGAPKAAKRAKAT